MHTLGANMHVYARYTVFMINPVSRRLSTNAIVDDENDGHGQFRLFGIYAK